MNFNGRNFIKYIALVFLMITFEKIVIDSDGESLWKILPLWGVYGMYLWSNPFFTDKKDKR